MIVVMVDAAVPGQVLSHDHDRDRQPFQHAPVLRREHCRSQDQEIAKRAGVSSAAVSRYFNNGYISVEKQEAIRKVVEETGDRPSIQAQTLRTKRTRMIGVIVPKVASASIGRIVEGILSVLNESEYQYAGMGTLTGFISFPEMSSV